MRMITVYYQRNDYVALRDAAKAEDEAVNQWTRAARKRLEASIQADADRFHSEVTAGYPKVKLGKEAAVIGAFNVSYIDNEQPADMLDRLPATWGEYTKDRVCNDSPSPVNRD